MYFFKHSYNRTSNQSNVIDLSNYTNIMYCTMGYLVIVCLHNTRYTIVMIQGVRKYNVYKYSINNKKKKKILITILHSAMYRMIRLQK